MSFIDRTEAVYVARKMSKRGVHSLHERHLRRYALLTREFIATGSPRRAESPSLFYAPEDMHFITVCSVHVYDTLYTCVHESARCSFAVRITKRSSPFELTAKRRADPPRSDMRVNKQNISMGLRSEIVSMYLYIYIYIYMFSFARNVYFHYFSKTKKSPISASQA